MRPDPLFANALVTSGVHFSNKLSLAVISEELLPVLVVRKLKRVVNAVTDATHRPIRKVRLVSPDEMVDFEPKSVSTTINDSKRVYFSTICAGLVPE